MPPAPKALEMSDKLIDAQLADGIFEVVALPDNVHENSAAIAAGAGLAMAMLMRLTELAMGAALMTVPSCLSSLGHLVPSRC